MLDLSSAAADASRYLPANILGAGAPTTTVIRN